MRRLRATFISTSGDLLLQAVDKVRRAEVRLGGQGVWEALHKSQWLWRKNPENLTKQEQERLRSIEDKNLCTAKAYQMRLVLQDIYRSADARTARHRFQVWCRWVRSRGSIPQGQPLRRRSTEAELGAPTASAASTQRADGLAERWQAVLRRRDAFARARRSVRPR